jgi:antitoxin (DNA-binding transcriptional repressor) of toxin-antitoxin stability system
MIFSVRWCAFPQSHACVTGERRKRIEFRQKFLSSLARRKHSPTRFLLDPNSACFIDAACFGAYIQSVQIEGAMKEVNVTELRQKLPAYLAQVQRGERVRVTSRGKVIAEISPPSADIDNAALARKLLRGSVVRYDEPLAPAIDPAAWDANR